MGLLGDDFNDPRTMATLALAGSLMGGRSFGQGLLGGVQSYQGLLSADQDMKLKKQTADAQLANFQSEIEARKLATVKDQRQQAWLEKYYGGQQGQPASNAAPAMPIGASGVTELNSLASPAPGQPMFMQRPSLASMTIDQVQEAKDRGGLDLLPAWKAANEGFKRDPGSFVDIPGKPREFIPEIKTGLNFKDGVVSAIPGFNEAQAGIEGAKAGAVSGAQSQFKPVKVYNPATQREEWTTEANVVGAKTPQAGPTAGRTGNPLIDAIVQTESGGNPNAVSPKGARGLMQVMPGTNSNPGFGVAPARDNSEGERTRVGQEYFGKMQERYNGNDALAAIAYNWGPGNTDMWLKGGGDFKKLPAETQGYVSQVLTRSGVNSQPQARSSGNYAAGPSAQETIDLKAKEATSVDTAKADVVRDTGDRKQIKGAKEMLDDVTRAKDLLKQGPTASGFGETIDKTSAYFGYNPKGAEIASRLDVVAGNLTKNVPRMEGPQSDGDREEYKTNAGRVGNRALPVEQRLAAADEVERLQKKYAGLNGGTGNTGGATGSFGAPTQSSSVTNPSLTASLSDITATAKASGKSTAQVTADLRAKGYKIGGR